MPNVPENNMNNTDRVKRFLREEGGRWTSQELAKILDMPKGSASSIVSVESRKSLQHGGAGIYALRDPENVRTPQYTWRSSKPFDEDIFHGPVVSKRNRRNRQRKKNDSKITLQQSQLAPHVWTDGKKTYRLVEVDVQINVVPLEEL